jgi:SAM-dependent methyltransferase
VELLTGYVIHFAPEPSLRDAIKQISADYADTRLDGKAQLALDIEKIDLPNDHVDTFIASHVLEHVDDRKALAELYRVLKPGGRALLAFPIAEGWSETYEDPEVVTTGDRDLHFGQFDHVRYYGADVRDRIRSAGFRISEYSAKGMDCAKYGLIRGETIFIATKAA